MTKKSVAGIGLALLGLAALFALLSFWRENWGANQAPGAVERFFAEWLLSGSRGGAANLPNPLEPNAANLAEGRDLYGKQCAFCHGEDGSGARQTGVQFYPPVPSLLPPQNDLTDSQMHAVIEQGVRYTAMPSFAKALSTDQIWKVVLWTRQLSRPEQKQAPAEPASR